MKPVLMYCPGLSEKWAEEFSSNGQKMIGKIKSIKHIVYVVCTTYNVHV